MKKSQQEIDLLNLNSGALFNPPRVLITLEAIKKIKAFVNLVSGEINGLGLVERRGNNFVITDAFILKQKVSQASAEINPLALNQYVGECKDPSKLKFQWHSHGEGSVFFSSTDVSTIARWLGDFIISMVVNKKGDYLCRLDLFKPFYLGLKVPLWVIIPVEEELISQCKKEIEAKVEEAGRFSRIARKILKRDRRISNWSSEKELVALRLEDMSFGEEEK